MFLAHALRECALFRNRHRRFGTIGRYLLAEYGPGYSVLFLATKEAGYGGRPGGTTKEAGLSLIHI